MTGTKTYASHGVRRSAIINGLNIIVFERVTDYSVLRVHTPRTNAYAYGMQFTCFPCDRSKSLAQ